MRSYASFALRRQALDQLVDHFSRMGLKQGELADLLAVSRPRANALMNGHVEQFSLDALVDLAERAELTVRLYLTRRYGDNR
jgi:predicted XRE-type DNA-binding protein